MSLPPPPQHSPGGDGAPGSSGSGVPAPGGGFGPPRGFGPPPGHPGAAEGYGRPGPVQPPYGIPPRRPGPGNRGAKVAAIVVGAVLAAAVAVGGVVLWIGGDRGAGSSAEPAPDAAGLTDPRPERFPGRQGGRA